MSAPFRIEEVAARIEAEVTELAGQLGEAADFAENSPEPDPAELYTDVLVEEY